MTDTPSLGTRVVAVIGKHKNQRGYVSGHYTLPNFVFVQFDFRANDLMRIDRLELEWPKPT